MPSTISFACAVLTFYGWIASGIWSHGIRAIYQTKQRHAPCNIVCTRQGSFSFKLYGHVIASPRTRRNGDRGPLPLRNSRP